jgi:antitoxin (DNA-binding transcriptional repressor) of toxin-antitoxin stability system
VTITTVDIGTTPTELADLLSLTSQGTEVVIVKGNQTLARMVPFQSQNSRLGNLHPDSIATTADFEEPLSDDFWLGAE